MPKRLSIKYFSASSLKINSRNARTHSQNQIRQVAESIREFGFVNPVLIDEENRVIAGHGRLDAAKMLGLDTVPVIRLANLSGAQKRALALADNKIAENAGWDMQLLAQEFRYLTEVEVDFDVTVTGFVPAEIDLIVESLDSVDNDSTADEIPDPVPHDRITVRDGDLWLLGEHRLLCGDATKSEPFVRLMGRKRAQMVFTDPPYNCPIDGHVCGTGRIKHEEFAMASGEMSKAEFIGFLESAFSNLTAYSVDGSIHFVFMDWRHIGDVLAAGLRTYTELKNLCVWNKTNAGMGTFYRSKHELIFVFKKGSAPHINNFELGQHGRHRTNVWDYPGVTSFRSGRLEELKMHPTIKPVALIVDAIKDCSNRGGIVLDPFAGSGTILIAAQKTGRRAYAMEIDAKYVETAIRRWEEYTGDEAVHAETYLTLDQLRRSRTSGPEADEGISETSAGPAASREEETADGS